MSPDQFNLLSELLLKSSGLYLTPDKTYLADVRLNPVAKQNGFEDADDLVASLGVFPKKELVSQITEAMTTNESFFFRDGAPFENFRDVIVPHMMKTRAASRRMRIWCAACSSGQEPYSLAMIIDDLGTQFDGWHIDIVATDISEEMLAKAKRGEYTDFEVNRGLPESFLQKYFERNNAHWTIKQEIRRKIDFRAFNLLDDPKELGLFDVVFCRNVLIYFEPDTKAAVLDRIVKLMPDDGFLTLGAAETVVGISESFLLSPVGKGLYRPNQKVRMAG